jgi:small-conductance mechanosensitive channel
LASIPSPVVKFFIYVILLVIGFLVTMFLFDQLIAKPADLQIMVRQSVRVAMIAASGSIIIVLIRRLEPRLRVHANPHAATIFSFFMILVTILVAFFAMLDTFQVSADTLLIGGGIVTIVIGLVISTVVGNIFAGALMLATSPFRVGDSVLVNNIPGKVEEVTSLFTRIRNDSGGETLIPNSALIQGAVIVTKIPPGSSIPHSLPYSLGDRIYTTYIGGEGTVTEIASFYTKILLDPGMEVTIPNNSVLAGSIQVARVRDNLDAMLSFTLKIDWDAERAIKAMKDAAISDQATFKSPLTVNYCSLDGKRAELKVSCEVDPSKKNEAKSAILRAAYLSIKKSEKPPS